MAAAILCDHFCIARFALNLLFTACFNRMTHMAGVAVFLSVIVHIFFPANICAVLFLLILLVIGRLDKGQLSISFAPAVILFAFKACIGYWFAVA